MSEAKYDAIAEEYEAIIRHNRFGGGISVVDMAEGAILSRISNIQGLDVCDLGCGTGDLSIQLASMGANVTGVDLSGEMLRIAEEKPHPPNVRFVQGDSQTLEVFSDNQFDLIISNLMMTDVPDLEAVYRAAKRVLRSGGRFLFTTMHPCFQAPHSERIEDENGHFIARQIPQYNQEGHWKSTYAGGIRGKVGAYHRMLSTYLNGLIIAGFTVTHLAEPTIVQEQYESSLQEQFSKIPVILLIEAQR